MDGFLQEGALIELDFENTKGELLKFKSLVETVSSDDLFEVYAPMYKGKNYPLMTNDELKIYYSRLNKSTGKYDIFCFVSHVVSRIRKENFAMIRLKRTTEVSIVQRRETYRLSYVKKMALTLIKDQGDQTLEILSKDISVGGMRGIVTVPLSENKEVVCHLFLGDSGKMDISGYVVFSTPVEDSQLKHDVRIQFHRVDKNDMKRLVSFINKVQADMIKKVSSGKHELLMRQAMGESRIYENSKREKNDLILSWINYSPFLLWLLFVGSLLVFLSGVPATEYPLQRFFNFIYRRGWNLVMLQNSIYLMFFTLVISVISMGLNRLRLKRDYDYFRTSYVAIAILSFIMIVVTIVLMVTQS
jgi:c-di-GMP-binding flagellar brake protein YcgR